MTSLFSEFDSVYVWLDSNSCPRQATHPPVDEDNDGKAISLEEAGMFLVAYLMHVDETNNAKKEKDN